MALSQFPPQECVGKKETAGKECLQPDGQRTYAEVLTGH